jgi:hypothetical protein
MVDCGCGVTIRRAGTRCSQVCVTGVREVWRALPSTEKPTQSWFRQEKYEQVQIERRRRACHVVYSIMDARGPGACISAVSLQAFVFTAGMEEFILRTCCKKRKK